MTNMKLGNKTIVLLSVFFSLNAFASDAGYTCAGKQKAIETQIAYAKASNNNAQVMGLNTALSDLMSHCTNTSLEKKYQDKVAEKTAKLAERQAELAKATAEGKLNKLDKLQRKIDSAQSELTDAQAQLNGFYQELKTPGQ